MCSTESVTENLLDQIFNRHSVKKFLRIIHVNVESITAHRETFLKTFNIEILDIIVLSETFLSQLFPQLKKNYNINHQDLDGKEGVDRLLTLNRIKL